MKQTKKQEPENNHRANRLIILLVVGLLCISAIVITAIIQLNGKSNMQIACAFNDIEYKATQNCWIKTNFTNENCPLPRHIQCQISGDVTPAIISRIK